MIEESQKHTDPDPQHWEQVSNLKENSASNNLTFALFDEDLRGLSAASPPSLYDPPPASSATAKSKEP
jgi:hypothetical protein